MPHSNTKLYYLVITVLFWGYVSALDSDKDQDLNYSAQGRSTSRIEGDARIITLEDVVKVTQGTLEISGDRAVFERELETGNFRRVSVTGSQAYYRQQLDEDGTIIEGRSDAIYYYVEGEPVIEFLGAASLHLPNDVLNCVSIKYFTESEFTETTGPCEGVSSR